MGRICSYYCNAMQWHDYVMVSSYIFIPAQFHLFVFFFCFFCCCLFLSSTINTNSPSGKPSRQTMCMGNLRENFSCACAFFRAGMLPSTHTHTHMQTRGPFVEAPSPSTDYGECVFGDAFFRARKFKLRMTRQKPYANSKMNWPIKPWYGILICICKSTQIWQIDWSK